MVRTGRYEMLTPVLIREIDPEAILRAAGRPPILRKRVRWDQGLLIYYPIRDQGTYAAAY